jgi:hypothetical protein
MNTDSTSDSNPDGTVDGSDSGADDNTGRTINTTDNDDSNLFKLTRSKLLLGLVLLSGIAGSGLARRALGEAGYSNLGVLIFVFGYAGMVFAVWFGWIRPLDITGPAGR